MAQFRSQHDRGEEGAQAVLELMRTELPQLSHWWECRSVDAFTTQRTGLETAQVGEVSLAVSCLRPVEHSDALIMVQSPTTQIDQQRTARLLGTQKHIGHAM